MDRLRDRRARCSPISIEKYTRASLKKPRPGRIDRSIGRNVSRRRSVPGVIHRFRWALGTDGIARRTGRGGSPWPPMSPDDHPPLRRSFASPDSPEYSAQKKGFCGTGSSKTRGGVRASGNRGLLIPVVAALRDCFSATKAATEAATTQSKSARPHPIAGRAQSSAPIAPNSVRAQTHRLELAIRLSRRGDQNRQRVTKRSEIQVFGMKSEDKCCLLSKSDNIQTLFLDAFHI